MQTKDPIRLDDRIYLIDGFDFNIPYRTGAYVLDEEQLTIIETGPSPSIKHIKAGLEKLGFLLDAVKYIIVTHVHLDHAGGAGLLLKSCPNATVVIHPRGKRHLANPRKLAAGARAVYGDSFSDLYDPIVPIPEERMVVKEDGDTLAIGKNCTLQFLHTPGHARHHFSIYDPISNGLFTGDTAGVRYQLLEDQGVPIFLPSTSPNQFDPNELRQSWERFENLQLDRIYYGHFGMTEQPNEALQQVFTWLDTFMKIAEDAYTEGVGYDQLADRMLETIRVELREKGIPDDHETYIILNVDMQICALGIIDYLQKQEKNEQPVH
ncbi:MBL fold metallo-hydrolase [Virgibacillus dokdonensis]|uniref:Flavo-diiron protein FprA1 n=1 Tax=Virgibacillus dokdonensis TaxID=302167 RepID=A0A2K9J1A7_9BACI|nr:MBL fold metallo-hydrolase [Virgibacillus dokdonensis]AUJ23791.1 Flavo-diiron protein FprA1 [Virgibacillus dokdonensis]